MYRSISTAAAWAALAGCATTEGYQQKLAGWIGQDEVALVRAWGAPARTHAVADRRFLVFESRQDLELPEVPATLQTNVKGNKTTTSFIGGSPATTITYTCTTTFELKAARVVGSTFTGNDCKARQ